MGDVRVETPVQNIDAVPSPAGPGRAVFSARFAVVRKVLRAVLSEYSVLLLAVAYFLVVWALAPDVATPRNLRNLFLSMLPLLAVAVGQTVVMISGGIDLSVSEHEVVCLIGASGSGKSTLLRCINLLEPIDAGRIVVGGD